MVTALSQKLSCLVPGVQSSAVSRATANYGDSALNRRSLHTRGNYIDLVHCHRNSTQRIDPETNGLYYNRARHYTPAWGRFLQTDPIGYAGGVHLYAYVANDPLNAIDPSGQLTYFTGGAGNNGPYIQNMVSALQSAGIRNVQTTPQNPMGMAGDLAILPMTSTYQGADLAANVRAAPINVPAGEQLNMIGYSSGAALSAQAALVAAHNGQYVNNLVLIGAPITPSLLNAVRSEPNIGSVKIIDLTNYGDPVHAGMSQGELALAVPTLAQQFVSGEGNGHFYYTASGATGDARRQDLANQLAGSGLK